MTSTVVPKSVFLFYLFPTLTAFFKFVCKMWKRSVLVLVVYNQLSLRNVKREQSDTIDKLV